MFPNVARTATNVQSLVVAVLPHGGQRSARRNAWASMSEDNLRARARREADAAMSLAASMSRHPATSAR